MRPVVRRFALAVVLFAALAVAVLSSGEERPVHVVVKGDTLSRIARRSDVTVRDLRAWNGLDGDRIEPGQRIFLAERRTRWERVASWFGRGNLRPPPDATAASGRGARPGRGVRAAGLRIRAPRAKSERAGAEVGVEGAAPDPSPEARWEPLAMPEPRPCLADAATSEPESGPDGPTFRRSAGLASEQVRASVARFQPQVARCFPGHAGVDGHLVLEFTVGCDGRVRAVRIVDDTVYDPEFAACVADVLRHAPFDPHARDEVVFEIPLTFEPAPGERGPA